MTDPNNKSPFTEEQKRAFDQMLKQTIVGGHGPACEHGQAMQGCINAFAEQNFHVADSAITWLMLFIEMSLLLPPDKRMDFSRDMIVEIMKLSAGLRDLPYSQPAALNPRKMN